MWVWYPAPSHMRKQAGAGGCQVIDFAVSQSSSNVGAPFLLWDYVGREATGGKNGEGVAATGII